MQRFRQALNALFFIILIEFGKFIVSKVLQALKTFSPISTIELSILTIFNFLQFLYSEDFITFVLLDIYVLLLHPNYYFFVHNISLTFIISNENIIIFLI